MPKLRLPLEMRFLTVDRHIVPNLFAVGSADIRAQQKTAKNLFLTLPDGQDNEAAQQLTSDQHVHLSVKLSTLILSCAVRQQGLLYYALKCVQ